MSTLTITDTNLVALKSKRSAVDLGYMQDKFIHYFVPSTHRKEVVLNKGYWCRYYCIYTLLEKFIKHSEDPVQIVSLGAGLDTSPFNLLVSAAKNGKHNLTFFESDLPEVVEEKMRAIKHHNDFSKFVEVDLQSRFENNMILGPKYNLFALDLNHPEQVNDIFYKMKIEPKWAYKSENSRIDRVRSCLSRCTKSSRFEERNRQLFHQCCVYRL